MEQGTSPTPILELLDVSIDTPAPTESRALPERPRYVAGWIAMAAALLVGVWVLVVRTDAGAPPALATPQPVVDPDPTAPPAGLAGFAELFVASYVIGDGGMPLRHFYAAAPEAAGPGGTRFVRHVATLSIDQVASGRWRVRLAADVLAHDGIGYQPQGVQHYAVDVIDTTNGFAATGLPMLIPAPAPAPIPAVEGMTLIEDAGLIALVDGFLAAYLAADGDIRAFVAAGADLTAVTPAPFTSIVVDELHGTALRETTVWLRSIATAEDGFGVQLVEHHLEVSSTNGTWSIERLAPGPPPLGSN